MSNTLANSAHQRSLRDFLTLYNTITEYCFNKCISKFNERGASGIETNCVDVCTDNYVQFNQRFMFNFVDHQERRKRDLERAAIEAAAKEQEQQQQQLQEAAAAMMAGQEQITPEAAIPSDLPWKTGEATQLLEALSSNKVQGGGALDSQNLAAGATTQGAGVVQGTQQLPSSATAES